MAFEGILFDLAHAAAEDAVEFTPEEVKKIIEYGDYRQKLGEWRVLSAVITALGIGYSANTLINAYAKSRGRHR